MKVGTSGAADGTVRGESVPVFLILGDSLTDGFTLGTSIAYPKLIEARLRSEGRALSVVNAGRSGDTAEEALQRLPAVLNQHAVRESVVDHFMVALGANDAFHELPIARTEAALRSILSEIRNSYPHATLAVAGVEPLRPMAPRFEDDFAAMFERVATDFSATLIPSLLKGVTGNPDLLMHDLIHPNRAGQKRIAETVWQALAPTLMGERNTASSTIEE